MKTKEQSFPVFGWMLALTAMAIVAASPLLALDYHLIIFKVAPALQAISSFALAH